MTSQIITLFFFVCFFWRTKQRNTLFYFILILLISKEKSNWSKVTVKYLQIYNSYHYFIIYILWQTYRAPISVALATEEEHLHTITAGWSAPAEAHQARASKAASARARGEMSPAGRKLTVFCSLPQTAAHDRPARRLKHDAQSTEHSKRRKEADHLAQHWSTRQVGTSPF